MAKETDMEPKVPTERPDRAAAARGLGPGAEDRPGADLGGAQDETSTAGSATRPGGSDGLSIDAPRLTPQGRTDPDSSGEDATDPMGTGAKQGQADQAEG